MFGTYLAVSEGMENKAYKTAISRKKLSVPMKALLNQGLIKGLILDYGCGKGSDVKLLQEQGLAALGYDPYYYPQKPEKTLQFDVVTMSYVINVIESKRDLVRSLQEAWSYVKPGGCFVITSRIDVTNNAKKAKWQARSGGYVTGTGTWQRDYSTAEIVKMARFLLGCNNYAKLFEGSVILYKGK